MMENEDKAREVTQESLAKRTVVEVLKAEETAAEGLRTSAIVTAKLEAYKSVYANFETFIKDAAEKLGLGKLSGNTFKEMSVARLVANWLIQTEEFINENEALIHGLSAEVRRGFIAESFSEYPDDIRDALLKKLLEKKHEVLDWFAKEVEKANAQVKKREKTDG